MKGKIFEKITAIILILNMTLANLLFVTTNVVYALSEEAISIEGGKIKFDAYFKNENDEKRYEKNANIQDGAKLYIDIELAQSKLESAKISINNANFKMQENIKNSNIDYINSQTGEIFLKTIDSNQKVQLEIPVVFEKQAKISTEYFSKESEIVLSGKYYSSEVAKDIENAKITTKLNWRGEPQYYWPHKLKKALMNKDKTRILIQDEIKSNTTILPKTEDKITATVPKIKSQLPDEIYILQNGKKIEQNIITNGYNINTGILEYTHSFVENNNIDWSQDVDTYEIIYIFNGQFDDLNETEIQDGKVQISSKAITYDAGKTSDEFTQNISFNNGTISSIEAKAETKETYKGFIYANSEQGTEYTEKYEIEISDKEQAQKGIEVNFENDAFKTAEGEIDTNNKTIYGTLILSEANIREILGANGIITIDADGQKTIIDNSTPSSQAGEIEITLNAHSVKITTSKIENEGALVIKAKKIIIGDAGLNKEVIQQIEGIKTTISTNLVEEEEKDQAEVETILKEPKTEAYLTMTNENRPNILATNRTNKVEIIATLKTGTEDTYLFKEPKIQITLPFEVKEVNNLTATALYAENELTIRDTQVIQNGGKNIIVIDVDGTQTSFENKITEGIKVTINADMVIGKYLPSRETKIKMEYQNENAASNPEPVELPISIYSTYGLIKDLFLNGNQEAVDVKAVFVNNYDTAMENVSIIGTIINNEQSQEEFENAIKESYIAKFVSQNSEDITGAVKEERGENLNIQYSSDKENWGNSKENAKYYKIFVSDILNSKETVYVQYQLKNLKENPKFEISANIEGEVQNIELTMNNEGSNFEKIQNEESNENENEEPINGENQENQGNNENQENNENQSDNNGQENPSEQPNQEENLSEKIEINVQAQVGDKNIKRDSNLKKGQAVTYTYTIKNNSNKDLNNFKISINYEGANLFGEYTYEQPDAYNTSEMKKFTILDELNGTSKIEKNASLIKAHEGRKFTSQIIVKEDTDILNTIIKISANELEEKEWKLTNNVENAEIKPLLLNNVAREHPLIMTDKMSNTLQIKNLTNQKLENIELEMTLPDVAKFGEMTPKQEADSEKTNYTIIEKEDNRIKLLINEIDEQGTKIIKIPIKIVKNTSDGLNMYCKLITKNDIYYSNTMNILTQEIKASNVEIKQSSNKEGQLLKIGDEIIYTFTIKNNENESKAVEFSDTVSEELLVVKVMDRQGEEIAEDTDVNSNVINKNYVIDANSSIQIAIVAKVNYKSQDVESIVNYAQITGNYFKVKSNEIANDVEKIRKAEQQNEIKQKEYEESKIDYIDENGNSNTNIPSNTQNNNQSYINNKKSISSVEIKNSISGKVWLDKNKDGVQDVDEKKLSGIKVMIADVKNGEFVKDNNSNRLETKTDSNGKYKFENLNPGKYIVVFEFDNIKYRNTQYQVSSAAESKNSDIITSKINVDNSQIKYGITDTLILDKSSMENIDAGLIENEIFDLSLKKYVNKVTVQNSAGTVAHEYNKEQLAKVEIDAKLIAKSTVLVEYIIEVTNEGELPGYANEIVDYIPKDVSFNSEINKTWYKSTDGNVHTNALDKTIINQGETKEVKLILTKTMTENNTGVTSNKAEIAKSSNNLSIPDKDSKEGNNASGEDDISTAELIISIRTGIEKTISIITLIIIATVIGIVVYTKKRKEVNYGKEIHHS